MDELDDRLAELDTTNVRPGWELGKGELVKPWSEIVKGDKIVWYIGDHVKLGVVITRARISMRVHFEGDHRPTNIPNARTYFVRHRMGTKEDFLYVIKPTATLKKKGKKKKEHKEYDGEAMTAKEACELFGIGGKELRRWLRAGKVRGFQRDGHWWVDASHLGRHLAERR